MQDRDAGLLGRLGVYNRVHIHEYSTRECLRDYIY
jgi:hypothetical protein